MTSDAKRESENDDQLQGRPFSTRYHSHGRALVSGVSLELSACRRIAGGARGADRPRDYPTLGRNTVPNWKRRSTGASGRCVRWRMDETYVKVKGQWYYLYRAVDKTGQTIDFLLTEHRDEAAALRFLKKAIRRHGVPEKITIDGSAANAAASRSYNKEHGTTIMIRQVKYLNNIVEQDHRGVKRVTRPHARVQIV